MSNKIKNHFNGGVRTYFKIYSKKKKSYGSDSIFNIIGRNEVALTKSLAYCFKYSNQLLGEFLSLIYKSEDRINKFGSITISAEEQLCDGEFRRDISITLNNGDGKDLIVVEAKNPIVTVKGSALQAQIANYFPDKSVTGQNYIRKYAVSLTKEKILLRDISGVLFISITWNEIIDIVNKVKGKDAILNDFYHHLTEESDVKTYDEEVFCPPCGNSYDRISKLSIYCCPAERNLKECLYLMPRIPVHQLRGEYPYFKNSDIKGKGVCLELYRILDSFVTLTDENSLNLIEDKDVRSRVETWLSLDKKKKELEENDIEPKGIKVFILGDCMEFAQPKFTESQNNSYQGYYNLSEIWTNVISKKQS